MTVEEKLRDEKPQYDTNDTMKAYFCYRHTLLQATALSTLFYLI